MRNIIASFRATGIYPPARNVVLSQIPGKSNDSQPHQSVPLVPFCTPRRFQTPSSEDSALLLRTPQCSSPFSTLQMELPTHNTEVSSLQFGPTFSSAEVRRYRVRLEEGYDLHDSRYAQWLSTLPTLHCNSATEDHGSSSKSGFAPKQLSTLEKILHVPTPPEQRKSTKYVKSGRVLTSEECMREAQEKEEQKKQKEEDKRKKAEERQRKAEERKKKAEEKQKDAAEKRKKADEKQKHAAENRKKPDEKQKEAAQKQNQKEGTKNVSRKEGKERNEEKGNQKGTRTLKNIQEGM